MDGRSQRQRRAVSWPTPGMDMSRRQAAEALVMHLTSASADPSRILEGQMMTPITLHAATTGRLRFQPRSPEPRLGMPALAGPSANVRSCATYLPFDSLVHNRPRATLQDRPVNRRKARGSGLRLRVGGWGKYAVVDLRRVGRPRVAALRPRAVPHAGWRPPSARSPLQTAQLVSTIASMSICQPCRVCREIRPATTRFPNSPRRAVEAERLGEVK